MLSKNTSTSYPLNPLPCYLPYCPKQPLWVLTFQPQSFQSCSLAVIFILVALQHHWLLYTILILSSNALLFYLCSHLFFSMFPIPPTILFHHLYSLAIFSLISCLPSMVTQTSTYPLPSLWFITSLFLYFLHISLPPLVCSFFTHTATQICPLCPWPLSFPRLSWSLFHPSCPLPCCSSLCPPLCAKHQTQMFFFFTPSWRKSCHRVTG